MNSNHDYSLLLRGVAIDDIQTLFITCTEMDSLPDVDELEKLQPVGQLMVPGGKSLDSTGRGDNAADFLNTVLSNATQVQHIVVCVHSGCSFRTIGSRHRAARDLHSDRRETEIATASHVATPISWTLDQPFEHQNLRLILQKQLCLISDLLESKPEFTNRKVSLHGWLSEPEIDWISFFDLDTGLLLPLNAHPELCP